MNGPIDPVPSETQADLARDLGSLVFEAETLDLSLVVRCHTNLVEKPEVEQEDWHRVAEAAAQLLTAIRQGYFDGRDAEPTCSCCGARMARFAGPGAERGWTCVRCDDQEPDHG